MIRPTALALILTLMTSPSVAEGVLAVTFGLSDGTLTAGYAAGHKTFEQALTTAKRLCQERARPGSEQCFGFIAFRHQCAAIVYPKGIVSPAFRVPLITGLGATNDAAREAAMRMCRNKWDECAPLASTCDPVPGFFDELSETITEGAVFTLFWLNDRAVPLAGTLAFMIIVLILISAFVIVRLKRKLSKAHSNLSIEPPPETTSAPAYKAPLPRLAPKKDFEI